MDTYHTVNLLTARRSEPAPHLPATFLSPPPSGHLSNLPLKNNAITRSYAENLSQGELGATFAPILKRFRAPGPNMSLKILRTPELGVIT